MQDASSSVIHEVTVLWATRTGLIPSQNTQLSQPRCLEYCHLPFLCNACNRFHTWTKPQVQC